MESIVHYLMTICLVFTTVNGASINSDMTDINNIVPEKCRRLLLDGNRDRKRTFCTEKPDIYPEELQKEIEARIGENDLFKFGVPEKNPDVAPLTNDDCTSVDAQQNCCTKSGWETPTFKIINIKNKDEFAYVVQSKYFAQEIKIVECANEEATCFKRLSFLGDMGYFRNCRTNYAFQKLFVYTNSKQFIWASVRTPVSCSCVISRGFEHEISFEAASQTLDENNEYFDDF